jgi:predicted esterase
VTIETAGGPRRVTFLFGAEPAPGRPLLFVFHGLGSTGRSMIPRMGLEELADQGVVVAIPEGVRTAKFGWGAGPKGVHDAILIEDVRRCAYDRLGVDLERVHVTGFSAGGLWSTLMLMHASELFASATIYSGGELPPFVTYTRPKHRVPALVIWGGAADVYRSRGFNVEFDGAARRLSDSLHRDGHFVVRCDHGGGHTLPVTYAPLLHAWTLAHRFGAPAELADWTLDRLPSGCEVMRPDR